jgi:Transposase DDE domain
VQGHQVVANGGDFEKEPFGTLERLITQKLLDVAKRVAKEELESEKWLLLGVRSDQTVTLPPLARLLVYPDPLRRVSYVDSETNKRIVFLTNNFDLAALTITQIYESRWQVELFFRWIKQHLRIKAFYGTTENAAKTQIWIAVSVYVLGAIVRKRLGLEATLYQILQVLSITRFEKAPILRALQACDAQNDLLNLGNQLILFDF